jgi:hypothetical protein
MNAAPPDPAAGPRIDLLTAFLAGADAPCPSCGYNLRGVRISACPECGRSLALALQGQASSPLSGFRLFLLLAFGWLALAGTMNSVRFAHQAYDLASHTPLRVTINSLTIKGAAAGSPAPVTGQVYTLTAPPTATLSAPAIQGWIATNRTGFAGSTSGPRSLNWAAVGFMAWARVGWAMTLAIGGGLGLLALAIYRRRTCSLRRRKQLVAAATSLFSLYAGWHIWWFIVEQARY